MILKITISPILGNFVSFPVFLFCRQEGERDVLSHIYFICLQSLAVCFLDVATHSYPIYELDKRHLRNCLYIAKYGSVRQELERETKDQNPR